ncbi:MAG: ornithine carbamoyltransferase [Proteobacteria bacterium]|nr:ornithine carbamoyltransferase [Pseudomonadota bacterium]MCH8976700.1 ornithine carbamoyltransferase [Pseudomonadota bacterium]
MGCRHFLTLSDLSTNELRALIERGIEIKAGLQKGELYQPFKGKVLAMIFEKSSTRTRVSFEAGMAQFGGHAIFMSPNDTQLGRGEPIEDTVRVLSEMVDAIMIRTFEQEKIENLAQYASVPIINGLSDTFHPCQLLADMQTYFEHRGSIEGKTVTWLGDGNNMCHSYINAARLYQFQLRIACPEDYLPDESIVNTASDFVETISDAKAAVKDADLVVTDVWASMGQEQEADERARVFAPYQVNTEVMSLANDDALFMHCLPAHRGEEVTADVIDGKQSVVWDEAGNRLHAQMALLEFLLTK